MDLFCAHICASLSTTAKLTSPAWLLSALALPGRVGSWEGHPGEPSGGTGEGTAAAGGEGGGGEGASWRGGEVVLFDGGVKAGWEGEEVVTC